MQTVLLSKTRHNRQYFDCGVEALNLYLRNVANQQSKRDNSRTFVLEDQGDCSRIVGFYTLSMVTIDLSALPRQLQVKHQSATSAGLIARLAVDKNDKGRGIGEWLLADALKKLLSASEIVGFPLVVVDAKPGVEAFYQQYGFRPFVNQPSKLFMTVANIRKSLPV